MTFLSLSHGLIAAALALPSLLALYLLKLRRRPMRVSSTLLWTQAVQDLEVNVPLRWLRASWLLLLQLLAALLLCLAIARPALTGSGPNARRVIFLIDRSASMSATDAPGGIARLELAKSKARASIEMLARAGGSGAVVTFAAQPTIQCGFSTSGSALAAAVSDITPTDQPADLAAALRLTDSMITGQEGGEESAETPELVLLSDGNLQLPARNLSTAAQMRFVSVGPVRQAAQEPGSTPPPPPGVSGDLTSINLAITGLSARRDDQDPATIRVFARVQNTAAVRRTVVLTLSLDAQPVQRAPLDVPGSTPAGDPGEATITLELVHPSGGLLQLSLPAGDVLSSDDSAALVLQEARKPSVLLVQPPAVARVDGPSDNLSPDWLLSDALKELPLGTLRRVTPDQLSSMSPESLAQTDLIIYDRVRPVQQQPVSTLSFGVPVGVPGVSAEPVQTPGGRTLEATTILSWDRNHPILRDVALDTLLFVESLRFSIDPAAADRAKVRVSELARSPAGPAILLAEEPTPARTVRRLGLSFSLQQSNWPISVGFPIFLSNAIDYLTLRAEQAAGQSFTTAEPAFIAASGRSGLMALAGPVPLTIELPAELPPDARVSLGLIERAGVYVLPASGAGVRTLAVNLTDAFESSLRGRSSLPIAGRDVVAGVGSVGTRELWPWLVMAAALLMALEWFLHAFKAKV